MGFLVCVVIIIVFLAILGLGWNTFFEGVKKGADKIGISSVIENVTNSGIEVAKNASREIIGSSLGNFIFHPSSGFMIAALLGVAIFGGMFVVPLYAFLTTTVDKSQTARTVAANNIVNSGAMVAGSALAFTLSSVGVGPVGQLLLVAAMCVIAAWLGWKLHLACD